MQVRTLLAALVLCAHTVCAQDPFFTVRHYGVEDGLLHRRVNALAQDGDGFLWVATPSGLHRFDGYTFRPLTEAEGLGRNQVMQIWTDAAGLLWLVQGSFGDHRVSGIDVLDPRTGQVTAFRDRFGEQAPVRADELFLWCSTEADGTLLLAAPGRAVSYHPDRGFTSAPLPTGLALLPLQRGTDGSLLAIAHREGDEDRLVRCGSPGVITETLLRARRIERAGSGQFPTSGVAGTYLRCEVPPGRTVEYWVPAGGVPRPLSNAGVREFANDMPRLALNDGLWCVRNVVRRMEAGDDPELAPAVFDVASAFPDVAFHIHQVFRDRAGHVWIGGEFGLYQLTIHPGLFQRFLWMERIPRGHGRRIRGMALVNGRLHVNAEREGYWVLDPATGVVLASDSTGSLGFALASDGAGGVWRGRGDSLLHVLADGSVDRAQPTLVLPKAAWSALPMVDGAVLIGGEQGLFRAVPGRDGAPQPTTAHPGLRSATVVHLARDRSGAIWACTSAGLFRVDEQGAMQEEWSGSGEGAHRLPTNDIRHLYEDAEGLLWISTGDAGLLRLDRKAGSLQAITRANGLPSNGVYAVFADKQGRFWMPTDNGLVRYTPATGAVRTFTMADGIAHNEFNRLAYVQGPDGRLYFGGLNGITAFDPSRFVDDTPGIAPPLVISDVNQFVGKHDILVDRTAEVRAGEAIVVRPGDRYFTVGVALLDFTDPDRIRYAWRLEGIDADWTEQREPIIRFTDLPFGEHVLRVKARGPGGTWSAQELAVPIEVVRPFYLRWWAGSAAVLLILGAVYMLFRYRLEQVRRTVLGRRDGVRERAAEAAPASTVPSEGSDGGTR